MRILTHPVHTAWEYEFAKTGHEIFTVIPDEFTQLSDDGWGACRGTLVGGTVWNSKNRPMPDNVKPILLEDALRARFDVCIVHTIAWLEKLRKVTCPIILKVHVMPPPNFIPEWAEEIISAITFNNEIAINAVITTRPIFKNVIHVPVDSSVFNGYIGDYKRCLSIAHLIQVRPEKRLGRLNKIASIASIDLVGGGNEGIPYAIGEARSFEELLSFYKHYAVFLEVTNQLSMSCIEAMMVGMPVVLFPLTNPRRSFLKNGENCLIAETEEAAAETIQYLFSDPVERKKLGMNARLSVLDYFDVTAFRQQWNQLLNRVVRGNLKK
ncbi:hypothetical protein COY65_01425 [Candidatus Jorgensenbacteria bacterium CG_4_10_14_0_8_um_filter_39_13]|uniref:Glycosyl transferase family 1 domain-containing protein n=1 Tax=Candidatus Jorgensenbacteria bacterium CG_4_10_14_0_8_um_filter_39_13 TaxID=1974589 RepID=A0A2M7RHE3_9BACT|nr:MAG: hypothetical protein COY65_01425 [Candidatus Jorgensenbacteria bacterium CG_4_10_14_0_8_um_filter_39_13]